MASASAETLPSGVSAEDSAAGRVLVWRVGSSTFTALPERGGRLLGWERRREDGSVRPVIFAPPRDATDLALARGGIPLLFPFAGASETGTQKSAWRDPQGVVRAMPMHGLARQGRFVLREVRAEGFTAVFVPDADARAAYPFDYELTVRYEFGDRHLVCELALANRGTEPLPWSAGLHPYFAVPWDARTTRADYVIAIDASRSWRRKGAGLVAGPAPEFPRPLADAGLRQTFWSGLGAAEISFGPANGPERVRLAAGFGPEANPEAAVVLWTESEESPFFCVEPFMGPTNAAETGVGLKRVAPGARQVFRCILRID